MSITGQPDGEPGGGPMRVGVAVVDLFTGLYTTVAILAALFRRERSGEGAHVDMALFDTQLAVLANQASNALVSGKDPPRQGNTHPNIVPYQPFQASDKPLIIAVGNDRQFAKLAALCGHPEWATDERFANNGARVANRDEIVRLVAECIATEDRRRVVRRTGSRGHPRRPDQHASARRWPTSRRSIARSCRTIAGDAAGRLAGPHRRRPGGFRPAAAGAGRAYRRSSGATGYRRRRVQRLAETGVIGLS